MKLSYAHPIHQRYVIFDPSNGDVLSLPNYKPEEGSYIPVEETQVTGLLSGAEPLSYYYVHYIKKTKTYELRLRTNTSIDSYFVDDLIYEVPMTLIDSPDIHIIQNINDTCWKITIGGDLKANILAQRVSFKNTLHFSITEKSDPNILLKTISFNFSELHDTKYVIVPFDSKFEFEAKPVSVYTIKNFDRYMYEVHQ